MAAPPSESSCRGSDQKVRPYGARMLLMRSCMRSRRLPGAALPRMLGHLAYSCQFRGCVMTISFQPAVNCKSCVCWGMESQMIAGHQQHTAFQCRRLGAPSTG